MSEIKTEESSKITELKIISNEHKFIWNFADIKQNLNSHIEKYVGLVVTEENLKDMESTRKKYHQLELKLMDSGKKSKRKWKSPIRFLRVRLKSCCS